MVRDIPKFKKIVKVRAMTKSTTMMVQASIHTVSARAMMTRHQLGQQITRHLMGYKIM